MPVFNFFSNSTTFSRHPSTPIISQWLHLLWRLLAPCGGRRQGPMSHICILCSSWDRTWTITGRAFNLAALAGTRSRHIWLHLGTSGHIWPQLATSPYIWPHLATSWQSWPLLATPCHILAKLATSGHGHIWPHLATCGYICTHLAAPGHTWPHLATPDHI